MSKRCGDCKFWMNHDECPLEEYEEQELYIQELIQRLSFAEKVCYEANGYLKTKDNPLGRIYLDRLADAVEKWDNSRKNKGAQYLVMEDWEE